MDIIQGLISEPLRSCTYVASALIAHHNPCDPHYIPYVLYLSNPSKVHLWILNNCDPNVSCLSQPSQILKPYVKQSSCLPRFSQLDPAAIPLHPWTSMQAIKGKVISDRLSWSIGSYWQRTKSTKGHYYVIGIWLPVVIVQISPLSFESPESSSKNLPMHNLVHPLGFLDLGTTKT